MNRLITEKGSKTSIAFGKTKTESALFAVILLTIVSTNTHANRPSVDEGDDDAVEQNQLRSSGYITSPRPTARPTMPQSAVENMMQYDQTQQSGDVLNLPAKEIQPGETVKIKLLDFPRRGMSMNKVQQEYGQPLEISGSVGRPPITHWVYADRVVYFEFSSVIHVVAR